MPPLADLKIPEEEPVCGCAFGLNKTLSSCTKQPWGHSSPVLIRVRQMKAPPVGFGRGLPLAVDLCNWEYTLVPWMKQPCFHLLSMLLS